MMFSAAYVFADMVSSALAAFLHSGFCFLIACNWQVTLASSTDAVLHNLAAGRVDAAILRSDVIAHAQQRGLPNTDSFKFVEAVSDLQKALLPDTFFFIGPNASQQAHSIHACFPQLQTCICYTSVRCSITSLYNTILQFRSQALLQTLQPASDWHSAWLYQKACPWARRSISSFTRLRTCQSTGCTELPSSIVSTA